MEEPSDVTQTRVAYNTVAADYAALLEHHLDENPYDRAVLALFADLVKAGGQGPVADLGCGPGRITQHLAALKLDAFGIDLSPAMVEVARQSYPGLSFSVGNLARLDLADGGLAGVAAWYSIIHTPPERVPLLLSEFHRILRPQGHLVLAFQVGDERVQIIHGYGHDVELDAYRLSPDHLTHSLETAGFRITARLTRAPVTGEKTDQAYLLAQRVD
ncbi:SAM-dependent methyltransferase [Nakamurella sp. UYEF19]|uniref:class I SAM-dependent DNA methyltransferase n=1 Tax=Nakamurella sp. UYEF19 TaxID=1756392 RepID=UPI00339B91D7